MGLRFDTVISCYLLSFPILYIIVGSIAGIRKPVYYKIIHILISALYVICFFACAADIPYFKYFFTRLNASALAWMDSFSFVFQMTNIHLLLTRLRCHFHRILAYYEAYAQIFPTGPDL